jgi:hypothetical protein
MKATVAAGAAMMRSEEAFDQNMGKSLSDFDKMEGSEEKNNPKKTALEKLKESNKEDIRISNEYRIKLIA